MQRRVAASMTVLCLALLTTVGVQSSTAALGGGGWIVGNLGGKATFGISGAIKPDGTPTGHLVFLDRSVGFAAESTSIKSFEQKACHAVLVGHADTNSASDVPFIVRVFDDGEPGAGADQFSIEIDGYANTQFLAGGNIQLEGC